MTVFLVAVGRDSFELYSEPVDPGDNARVQTGRVRRVIGEMGARWNDVVHSARTEADRGWLARWRDRLICRLAESIAEQRTLWALNDAETATLRYPAPLPEARVRFILRDIISIARRHHLRWIVIDASLFVASGLFFLVPGPNLIAYYFAFRLAGHWLSWRGARRALDTTHWRLEPDEPLGELATLVDVPRETRAPRVHAIAARLNLERLPAFFDRAAVPSA